MVEKMLEGAEIQLGVDYFKNREKLNILAKNVIFTGAIDEYFDYKYGA